MTWRPNYSDPIFGLGELAAALERIMRLPDWSRRRWLKDAKSSWKSRHIYRYQDFDQKNNFSIKKADDLLVQSKLFLPSPSTFNDPYEFQARVILEPDPARRRAHFRKVGRQMGLRGLALETALTNFILRSNDDPYALEKILIQQRERFGIACFSLNPRNLKMWSLYAAGHSGLCLQFDVAQDVGFAAKTLAVSYKPEIATLNWPDDRDRIMDDVILQKWDAWREEEEVRYVSQNIVNSYLPISPAFVKGIILGARFPNSSMPALDDLLQRRKESRLPKLKLFRADRFQDKYGMFIRRLNDDELRLLANA